MEPPEIKVGTLDRTRGILAIAASLAQIGAAQRSLVPA